MVRSIAACIGFRPVDPSKPTSRAFAAVTEPAHGRDQKQSIFFFLSIYPFFFFFLSFFFPFHGHLL